MTLPKFNAYDPPIMLENNSINISDAFSSAKYCCNPKNHPANNLFGPIEEKWLGSKEYKAWQAAMPSKTPQGLRKHQSQPANCNASAISGLIKTCGDLLTSGQVLFHAGAWSGQNSCTTKPLSTSMSPGPAFMNGLWRGKAHRLGFLDLWVLEIASDNVRAFVYKHRGNVKFKQELEVLLPSGVNMSHQGTTTVSNSFPSSDANGTSKMLAVKIVHLKIS